MLHHALEFLQAILPRVPQAIVFGVTQGSVYALIALGYTLVYGVLRLINFAHGDVYMLGAYAGMFAAARIGTVNTANKSVVIMIGAVTLVFLIAMAACAAAGVTIERLAYRPLRNSPRLAIL